MDTIIVEKSQFEGLLKKLDKIATLLALNITRECKTQKEKILLLSSLNYSPTEIAKMLNATVSTVTKDLSRSRKEKDEKNAKTKKATVENGKGDVEDAQ
jgi:DNA-directed RNA polymerase specialized sigma24 family protein